MVTLVDCNTAEVDVAADTKTTIYSGTIPAGRGGRIKYILLSFGPVATTLASVSGYLDVDLASHAGPYRIPVMSGSVDGDLFGNAGLAEKIPCDIPVDGSEAVIIEGEFNGAIAGCNCGIMWEAPDK